MRKKSAMKDSEVIDNIRQVAASVLPKGSSLYLYGSRARGDAIFTHLSVHDLSRLILKID